MLYGNYNLIPVWFDAISLCVHREMLLNQTEFRLYLSLSDWFGTKRTSFWFQINRWVVNTIWIRFDLIRFGKDFSVCVCIGCMLGIFGATSYARCGPVNENSLQFSRGFEFCSSRYMNPVSSSLVQEKWTSKTITNKMNRLMRNGRAKHKMCVP